MSETMIERVARSIWLNPAKCDLRNVTAGPCGLNDECSCWEHIKTQARAAIAAMREPTDAMCDAGAIEPDFGTADAMLTWQAMIDAALNEAE